ncbi:unnamed protein product, partial [marine sediment metagenome]
GMIYDIFSDIKYYSDGRTFFGVSDYDTQRGNLKIETFDNNTFAVRLYDSATGSYGYMNYNTLGEVLTGNEPWQPGDTDGKYLSYETGDFFNYNASAYRGFESALEATISFGTGDGKEAIAGKNLGLFFNALLNAKADSALFEEGGEINPALLAKLMAEALRESALSIPIGELSLGEMELAMMLANILANPTEDQKVVLDALASLLSEAEKLEEETGSTELKAATDDFVQMVATCLLAQALPG